MSSPPGGGTEVTIEVRPVGPEGFEDVYPLLRRFPTSRMSPDDWRYTLFSYPWSSNPLRGHILYASGLPVGFIGTVFSERTIRGRLERFCNPSSWIVLDEFRYAAMLLLRAVFRLTDHTIVSLTPSPAAYGMLARLGRMSPLETEQIVLPPLPGPVQMSRAFRGKVTSRPADLRAELPPEERQIYEDHASSPVAVHLLLSRGSRSCYVVATRGRKKRVPFAEIQHVGDRAFFWENWELVQAALVRQLGLGGLAVVVDRRFLHGKEPPFAFHWKTRRLFRPAHDGISALDVDGMYSEMMGLRF